MANERFGRVVGKRQRPPTGQVPSSEARRAQAEMARYRTRAPKGIFIYASHEEANRDREAWQIESIVASQRG